MLNLSDIFDPCGPNPGGLVTLKVIPVDSVESIPAAESGVIADELTLKDGATFYQLYFANDSASFKEPAADDDQGEFFKPAIQVYIPMDQPSVAVWIQKGKAARYICYYQDANGLGKLVGTLDYPLRLKADLENSGNKNGHTFTFSGDVPDKALFYLSDVPSTGDEDGGSGDPGDGNGGGVSAQSMAVTAVLSQTIAYTSVHKPFIHCVNNAGNLVEFACQFSLVASEFTVSFSYPFTGTITFL